jgi:membrane-bound lytic murein transglycosylase F
MSSSELITLVVEEVIDYTVADSNDVALMRRYHPEVRVAFNISEQQKLAWAMPKSDDDSLYQAAVAFFDAIKESGELKDTLARHYGHIRNYDYAGTPTYMRHIQRRLPTYMEQFQAAAKTNDLDWRLLAAVAYQESHWNPLAVSPTGVRGIMMLTKVTAAELGVKERTDPIESIQGGARYLRTLFDKFAELAEPDRTWLALAAYNVGYGHVKDAQWLTEQSGGDPTQWTDVKQRLPLLRQRKWYRQTKYGYARGNEPVRYVENIRSYYDILRWQIDREKPRNTPSPIMAFSSPVL